MDRHSPYFDLLEQLEGDGCVVCRLSRRSVSRYLDSVSYESVTDPAVRDRLRAANGLCRPHGRQYLDETRDPLGLAIINRDVLKNVLRQLPPAEETTASMSRWQALARRAGGRKKQGSAAGGLAPTAECPACVVLSEAEGRFAGTLVEYLSNTEVAGAYARHGKLCLPHFARVLGAMPSLTVRQLLVDRQKALLEPLERELAEYERKSDYRYRHESLGSERDAPARALDLLMGEF